MDDKNQQAIEALEQNSFREVESLRSAIYDYELKTISNLQFINGGGAAVLVGFLSQSAVHSRYYFGSSIISFLMGLIFSILLSFISPDFLELRFRQNQKFKDYKKYKCLRNFFYLDHLFFL